MRISTQQQKQQQHHHHHDDHQRNKMSLNQKQNLFIKNDEKVANLGEKTYGYTDRNIFEYFRHFTFYEAIQFKSS